jgi:hypothetical protein
MEGYVRNATTWFEGTPTFAEIRNQPSGRAVEPATPYLGVARER